MFLPIRWPSSPSITITSHTHSPTATWKTPPGKTKALLEGLSDQEALLAFGEHYRCVLATPEGSDHGNIRALIAHGLAGVTFTAPPLTHKV